MKIDWLRLENFKNLKDFEVDFSLKTERQVIIGRNGVGKSNILEAIAWIFRDLDLAEESDFEYSIKYKCRNRYIKIVSKGESSKKPKRKSVRKENVQRYKRQYWIINDAELIKDKSNEEIEQLFTELSESEFNQRNQPIKNTKGETCFSEERVLPDYVFGYYSGISARFNQAFEDHERSYYEAQKEGEEAALRTMFLAKPHHSQFSLLSFFAQKDPEAEKFLKEEFGIEHLSSVLFKLQEPYWSSATKKNDLKEKKKDRRFWGAKGKVDPFLDKLFNEALLPMGRSERKEISIKRTTTIETRYCFLPSEQSVLALAEGLDAKVFFSRLESTIFSDLLSLDGEGLKIRVKLTGVDTPITFKEMSEGEQQLLTIIGLMRFTQQNESLFLLDEPDTHLNPAWCLDLLKNLREYGVDPENSQILITTHSPLTFAGLNRNEVLILEKNECNKTYSFHAHSDPKGMSFSSILTTEFFGLKAAIDNETIEQLEEKRYLEQKEELSEYENLRLHELNKILRNIDLTRTVIDPLYNEFVKAIKRKSETKPNTLRKKLSSREIKEREKLVDEVLMDLELNEKN